MQSGSFARSIRMGLIESIAAKRSQPITENVLLFPHKLGLSHFFEVSAFTGIREAQI